MYNTHVMPSHDCGHDSCLVRQQSCFNSCDGLKHFDLRIKCRSLLIVPPGLRHSFIEEQGGPHSFALAFSPSSPPFPSVQHPQAQYRVRATVASLNMAFAFRIALNAAAPRKHWLRHGSPLPLWGPWVSSTRSLGTPICLNAYI